MREAFIVFDFETSGMSPQEGARATEIGAVRVENGKIVSSFQSLMNAGVRIPPFIRELTGISDAMIAKAPPAKEVMRDFRDFLGDLPLVAHNASFDRRFLEAELSRIGLEARQPIACSMLVSRRIYPDAPDHKLGSLLRHLGIETGEVFHRALADAHHAARLWLQMETELHSRYGFEEIPFEMMKRLESVPKRNANDSLRRWANRS